jgi:branched-chain amino acid transport system permease protein
MIFRPQGLFPVRQQLLAYGSSARELLRRDADKEPVS